MQSCTLTSHVLHMHWTLWDTILLHAKLWSIYGSPFLFPGLKSFDEDKACPSYDRTFDRPFISPPHTPPPPIPFSECWEECSILRTTAYTMPFSTEPGRRRSYKHTKRLKLNRTVHLQEEACLGNRVNWCYLRRDTWGRLGFLGWHL